MIAGRKPLPNIPAAFLKVSDRQVDQLRRRVFGRERSSRLDRFADCPVQAFNCVGAVDDLPDGGIKSKERDHFLPSSAPSRCDRGIFPSPFFLEGIQLQASLIGCKGTANPPQISGHLLAIVPNTEVQRVTREMDNARLHDCISRAHRGCLRYS